MRPSRGARAHVHVPTGTAVATELFYSARSGGSLMIDEFHQARTDARVIALAYLVT